MLSPDEHAALRLEAPGCRRDLAQGTELAVELPFFADAKAADAFIARAVTPNRAVLPAACRFVDLGGGDGFLAARVRDALVQHGHDVEAFVADGNARALLQAQKRGLSVLPTDLETLKLDGAHLLVMRLVNHYNGHRRQRRIFERAFRCLAPSGLFVCQAETGDRLHCAFRNLLSRRLRGETGDGGTEACRWLSLPRMERLLVELGFRLVEVDAAFMAFDMRLEELLELSWNRSHAPSPAAAEHRRRFIGRSLAFAEARLSSGAIEGLSRAQGGGIMFRSRHALVVARKPAEPPAAIL